MTMRELCCRLAGLLRRKDHDPDLADEIASHLELAQADYRRRGLSEAEAQRLAAMEFGSVAGAREDVWEQRQIPGLSSLVQDARYAARCARKSPGFTLVVVATLAFGMGLTTALFSLVDQLLLWSVPAREANRLVKIEGTYSRTYPFFRAYHDLNQVFDGVLASSDNLGAGLRPPGSRGVKSATWNTSVEATSRSSELEPLPDELSRRRTTRPTVHRLLSFPIAIGSGGLTGTRG